MKKVLSVVLMLALMLALFAGCGKAKKENNAASGKKPVSTQSQGNNAVKPEVESSSESENEPEAEPEDEPEEAGEEGIKVDPNNPFTQEFLPLDDHKSVLATFKEFGYVYNTKPEGQTASSWSFHYVSLGKETIDGVETEHYQVTQVQGDKTTEFDGWYTADWDTVKYKDSNGEKTGMDASFAGAGLTMYTQLYCNSTSIAKMVFTEDGSVDDFMYTMKGKRGTGETADLGNGPVGIDLYDIEDKLTHFDRLFGLSKVNGALMYTIIESINKEKDAMEGLRVTHAVPR